MTNLKRYTRDLFPAITSLGSPFFYVVLTIFLIVLGKIKVAVYLASGLMISIIFVAVLRIFYFKERPHKEDYFNLFTKINASSFPSLHAMGSMYAAVVLSNNVKMLSATIFFIFTSLFIGYSRVYLKKHYFIDVLVGFLLGIILGAIYLFVV